MWRTQMEKNEGMDYYLLALRVSHVHDMIDTSRIQTDGRLDQSSVLRSSVSSYNQHFFDVE